MKLILLSDLHLLIKNPVGRLDDLTETQWNKLSFVFGYAKDNDASILQAGDFTDIPRSWELLPKLIAFLKHFKVPVYSVYGQHDTYMYNEETRDKTIMGILIKAGLIEQLTLYPLSFYGVCFYGCSFGQEPEQPNNEDKFNILVIHKTIGIKDSGYEYTDAKRFLKKYKYDLILVGDVHQAFKVKIGNRVLINTGCMLRKDADLYSLEHEPHFYVFDTETKDLEKIIIPHEPSEKVISREHIESKLDEKEMFDVFIKSLKENKNVTVDFIKNLEIFIKQNEIEKRIENLIAKEIDNYV